MGKKEILIYGKIVLASLVIFSLFLIRTTSGDGIWPIISLVSPANNSIITSQTSFSCNISDNIQVQNLTFNIWNSSGDNLQSSSVDLTGIDNLSSWDYIIPYSDSYLWNCFGCSSLSCSWGFENYTLIYNAPDINLPYFTGSSPYNIEVNNNTQVTQQINATDETLFDCFTLNDTYSIFTINCSGYFENNSALITGLYNFNVTINDTTNNKNYSIFYVNVSDALFVDTIAPYFIDIANISIQTNDSIEIDFNATDETAFDSWITNDTRFSINSSGWFSNITGLPTSLIFINVTINDTSNNVNSSIVVVNVSDIPAFPDAIYPIFSDYLISIANGTKYNSNNYEFNSTILNTNGTAGIEFNGNNYTLFNISSSFYKNLGKLSAGVYSYYFWSYGNGSSNLYNITNIFSYTILINSSYTLTAAGTTIIEYPTATDVTGAGCPNELSCALNESNQIYAAETKSFNYSSIGNENYSASSDTIDIIINKNSSTTLVISGTTPISYPVVSDFAGAGCPSQLSCSMDKSDSIYAAGTITFNYSTSGNENYTATSITKDLIVSQNTTLELGLSAVTPITYGTITDFTGNGCKAELSCALNITNQIYSAGSISANYSTAGNQNYSSASAIFSIIINQAASQTSLTFDKTSPQNYLTSITPACALLTGVGGVSLTNGTSGVAETLAAGVWNFNCSYAGNENYTASSNFTTFTINQAAGNIDLLLNNTAGNINFEVGGSINASASSSTGQDIELLKDNINRTIENNIFNSTMPAGYYNYTALALSNQNYSQATISRFLNITSAIDTLYPLFSNYYDNNATIQGNNNGTALFNVTILNSNGTVWLSINGANYTATNLSASVYNISITGLNNGTYFYNWSSFGNGTSHLFNMSNTRSYIINNTPADATPPYFTYLANVSIQTNDSVNIDFNATDETAFDSWITNDTRFSINSSGWFSNITGLPTSLIFINVTINDSSNNINSSVVFVNISSVADLTPPYFTTIPTLTNINYTQGFGVLFEAVDETLFDSYSINWTTEFQINQSGWLENTTQLPAGSYLINLSINDSSNNLNSTIYEITVNKAIPNITLTVTSPITYGVASDFTCAGINVGGVDLTYNLNQTNKIYGAGLININCSTTGGQNYTSNSTINSLTINQASTITNVLTNPSSPIVYTQNSNFSCSRNNADLFIDSVNKTAEKGLNLIRKAGTYTLNCTFFGNINYSSSSQQVSYTINQNSSQTSLTFDKTSPQNYLTSITPACALLTGVGGVSLTNGTSGVAETLAAGVWNFNCSYAGNENYTASSNFTTFTITKAAPTLTFLANSGTSNLTLTYPQQVNISARASAGILGLDKDSVNYSSNNGVNIALGAGSYIFRANITGNENYSDVIYSSYNVTISKAAGLVYAYINNSRSNFTADNRTRNIYLNATLESGVGEINLTLNSSLINTGSSLYNITNLSLGYYNLTASYSGNENYTSSQEVLWINISEFVSDTTPLTISLISPADAYSTTSTSVTFYYNVTDVSSIANCSLLLNNAIAETDTSITVNITQTFTRTLTAGSYTWGVNCTDDSGNINNSNSRSLTIVSSGGGGDNPAGGGGSGGGGGGGGSAPVKLAQNNTINSSIQGTGNNNLNSEQDINNLNSE